MFTGLGRGDGIRLGSHQVRFNFREINSQMELQILNGWCHERRWVRRRTLSLLLLFTSLCNIPGPVMAARNIFIVSCNEVPFTMILVDYYLGMSGRNEGRMDQPLEELYKSNSVTSMGSMRVSPRSLSS